MTGSLDGVSRMMCSATLLKFDLLARIQEAAIRLHGWTIYNRSILIKLLCWICQRFPKWRSFVVRLANHCGNVTIPHEATCVLGLSLKSAG